MGEMTNFCFVKRCRFNCPLQAYNIFYTIDFGDRIPYTGEKSTTFVRSEFLSVGDDVVENLARDDEVGHVRSCR